MVRCPVTSTAVEQPNSRTAAIWRRSKEPVDHGIEHVDRWRADPEQTTTARRMSDQVKVRHGARIHISQPLQRRAKLFERADAQSIRAPRRGGTERRDPRAGNLSRARNVSHEAQTAASERHAPARARSRARRALVAREPHGLWRSPPVAR